MLRTRSIAAAATLGLAAPVLASAAPADATPPYFETINETYADHVQDMCDIPGFDVDLAGIFQSRLKIRTDKAGIQYFLEHITTDETWSVGDGRSVRVLTSFIAKDLDIVDNGDVTLTITQLLTGPSTMYNSRGKPIARDPGQVRFRLVVDTNGTPDDPGDDIELSREQIKGSTGRSDDYCAAMYAELG